MIPKGFSVKLQSSGKIDKFAARKKTCMGQICWANSREKRRWGWPHHGPWPGRWKRQAGRGAGPGRGQCRDEASDLLLLVLCSKEDEAEGRGRCRGSRGHGGTVGDLGMPGSDAGR